MPSDEAACTHDCPALTCPIQTIELSVRDILREYPCAGTSLKIDCRGLLIPWTRESTLQALPSIAGSVLLHAGSQGLWSFGIMLISPACVRLINFLFLAGKTQRIIIIDAMGSAYVRIGRHCD